MTNILLVRHGETVWNAEKRVQGWSDSSLSDRGAAQAEMLARRLALKPIRAVYCSDLSRAVDTARVIAAPHDISVIADPALRERRYGEWEGLTQSDLEQRFPDAWHRFHRLRQLDVPVPGGETWSDVQDRIIPVLARVLTDYPRPSDTIALVGHGGSLRALVLDALRAPLDVLLRIRLDNASLTHLEYRDAGNGRLIFLNDTSHLGTDVR